MSFFDNSGYLLFIACILCGMMVGIFDAVDNRFDIVEKYYQRG